MNKSLKEIYENPSKQEKEMYETVQDLKREIESIKKTIWGNPGNGKFRKEKRNDRCKHYQPTISEGGETLNHRRYDRRNWYIGQRKY